MNKAAAFKALHARPGGFVMPNAWDAGSAVVLSEERFEALGTTSAGIAFSLGRPDFDVRDARIAVTRDEMLARAAAIVAASPLPVNGDLEDGYGKSPEAVAETIARAIRAGLAGANIEDNDPRAPGLYDTVLAVERIRAARAAIDAAGSDFVLTAKIDAFVLDSGDALRTCIERGNLLRAAGADCVYPLLVTGDLTTIRTMVREIDAPINVVLGWAGMAFDAVQLIEAGVKRVSLGGSIARSALGFVRLAARELRERGSIGFAAGQIPQKELNALFERHPPETRVKV